MKKLLILVLSLVMASATSFAEEKDGQRAEGNRGGGDRFARMQENLGLSDEQVEQMREIRENGGGREEMRAVFTDEQRAMMKERQGKSQGRHGKGHAKGKGKGKGKSEGKVKDNNEGVPEAGDPEG